MRLLEEVACAGVEDPAATRALLLFSSVPLGVTSYLGPTVPLVVTGLGLGRDKRGAQLRDLV